MLDAVRRGDDRARRRAGHRLADPRAGFERSAFETIVASGPNAALPHAQARRSEIDRRRPRRAGLRRRLRLILRRPDPDRLGRAGQSRGRARCYEAVFERTTAPSRPSRPGQSRFDDRRGGAASRSRRAGMGEAFGHGTGHGLGIEVHEDPRIARRRPDVDTERRSGRGRDGLHHRAWRLSSRAGAAFGSRTTCW